MIIYQTEDGAVKVDVQMADETVWLTMDGMAKLFDKSRSTINEHILNIFEEGELTQEESVRKSEIPIFLLSPPTTIIWLFLRECTSEPCRFN